MAVDRADKSGFEHVGALRELPASAPDPADPRRWFDPVPMLADHAPVNYTAALERLG